MVAPEGEPPDEAAYATRIEEAFIAERGTPFLLSPKDWLLIRGWRERGVPVDTVVRAVRETFEKRRVRGQAGKISSISYCENAVEEQWEMERRGLVGKASAVASAAANPEKIAERLQRLARDLADASTRETRGIERTFFERKIDGVREKLLALAPDAGFDTLEEKLSRLESSFLRSFEQALEPSVRALVVDRVSSALGDTEGVSGAVVERMKKALTRREVRNLLGLPSLTLFDV
jgi:hypothetical protein